MLDASAPRHVRIALALLVAWLAVDIALTIVHGPGNTPRGERFVYDAMLIVAGIVAVSRGSTARLIGAGLTAWGAGDVFYTAAYWTADTIPVPSPADAGYLFFPFLVAAGMLVTLRRTHVRIPVVRRVDGLTAALSVAAVGAALVWDPVQAAASGAPLAVVTNLAYVVLDLALLAVCVGAFAVRGWSMDRAWLLCGLGVLAFYVADSLYLVHTANGDYVMGSLFDQGWSTGIVVLAIACWQPVPSAGLPGDRLRSVAMPLVFAGVALGLLAYAGVGDVDPLAVVLATIALVTTGLRLLITARENARMLGASRREAVTDALTGLGNRRALSQALDQALDTAGAGESFALLLADLDGFKRYNDTFGHPAGDALLTRLGERLAAAAVDRRGTAYRLGGDEFCVLLAGSPEDTFEAAEALRGALTEHGEGFEVGCSVGLVLLPEEATEPGEALRIADQRLYAAKNGGRATAERQSKDVLIRALVERSPELVEHSTDVATLSEEVARRLGLTDHAAREVRHAAELHDVGKVAVPDAILAKPGPLDEHEWAFIRQHTLIGERIIAAAPALARVAPIVRASHERWDGRGYPDGTEGDHIPLGARIVAVADAYDAMVADRPYEPARTSEAALTELCRCAGSQFDPAVVAVFCEVVRARRAERPAGEPDASLEPA